MHGMAVRLVMLGPPGAGKGTQAERVARERGVPRVSTGDILRDAVQAGTELGRAAKSVMASGALVSDDVVIGIVRERLARPDAAPGFVLDGFPRTVAQAEALDESLDHATPLIVLDIEVPTEVLVARISSRRICGSCGWVATPDALVCQKCGGQLVQRPDDTADVVRERLRVYERDTQPLVEFYHPRATFRAVDGDQPPEGVARDIAAAIAAVLGAQR
jgi:adenylate kinase